MSVLDSTGINLAHAYAKMSPDPWFKVGAALIDLTEQVLVSAGYNAPPDGTKVDWSDREARRPFVVHAEVNALRHVGAAQAKRSTLFLTCLPCVSCLGIVAAHGVRRVVFDELPDPDRYPLAATSLMATVFGIHLDRFYR